MIDLSFDTHADDNLIAVIRVSNPERLNVIGSEDIGRLTETFLSLPDTPNLRAAVLTGSGNKAFIGGADIREMAKLDPDSAETFITGLHQACNAIRTAPIPVIARISGYCLGAGLEIAAACDLRIAADSATFGMPEVQVGLPSVIEAALLPRLIGWGRTSRLLYSGELIDAQRAEAWGLIEQRVAPEDLDRALQQLLSAIESAGANAIRAQKALLRQWETQALDQAVTSGIGVFKDAYSSDEPRRMLQAFLNRSRTP